MRGHVTYPPVFDRRWDLDVVLQYPLPAGSTGGSASTSGAGCRTPGRRAPIPLYSYDIEDGMLVPQVGSDDDQQPRRW
jgi:hypothetical protein